VPLVARLLTEMVRVEDPPVVIDDGENEAVMRLLDEVALSVTLWLEPVKTAVDTVVVVDPPMAAVPDVGVKVSEKSLGAFTVKVYVAVFVPEGAVPVTVKV